MKYLFLIILLASSLAAQNQPNVKNDTDYSLQQSGEIAQSSRMAGDTIKLYQLPEVVVTATRLARNPADVGRSITVISREQIDNSIFNSVAEALSQHPGIYVVGTGQNPGMLQSIFLRGAASNHSTIMIDDVRITDPSAVNNALDASELWFGDIDRLEIVRGSHSTLYGSSAIGGVVNIITRKDNLAGFQGNAEVKIGTFGKGTTTLSGNLLLNYSDPSGFYVHAGIENSNTKGLDATVDTVTNPDAFKNRDRDGFLKRNLLGKAGFRNGPLDLYVSYRNTDQKVDLDKGAYRDDDNYTLRFKRNLFTYGASYNVSERFSVKYVGGYSDMRRVTVDDSSVVDKTGTTDRTYSDGTWKGTTATDELQGSLRLPGFEAALGIGSYRETMSAKTYFFTRSFFGTFESRTDLDTLRLRSSTNCVFAHFDLDGTILYRSFTGFKLGLGSRLNKHSTYGSNATYEINPSVQIADGTLLYAAYTTGFNAPSLYQLYAPDKNFDSGITRGNKALEPERSVSYEIGVKHSINAGIDFSVSYFRTVVDNSIEYVYLWDKNIGLDTLGNDRRRNDFRGDTYLNIGQQTNDGVEFALTAHLSERLLLSGNISFVSGKWSYNPTEINNTQTGGNHVQVYSNGAFVSKQVETLGLVRRPNTANLSVRYRVRYDMMLRLDARIVGVRNDIYYSSRLGPFGALATVPVEQYTILDLSQQWKVSRGLSIGARVENLFDLKYSEINGYTTRGRGIYLSVKYGFAQ